ncbi:DUF1801 domain-containing protein [Fodinibius halophilus]|uniref:DUF1801 domain-containing protein n=1 Tax=Fodinibius halophilus TaxID=1736908 RepID=A0A6M1T4E9_9BACT|nr:DUF1801 domain-containing protein [Fodinibius halophilus]NGP88959.1 DUF1801 domain-containing protein [Fodinibius halophilus]
MAKSKTQTVEGYIQELPEYRRETIEEIRELILDNLPDGYEETISWGMINYEIPLEKYPDTYNNQPLTYVGLAAQKNHNALYLMSAYQDEEIQEWLEEKFEESNKEMDMGRSCLRFQTINDLPLEAIAELIAKQTPDEFIEAYEETRK